MKIKPPFFSRQDDYTDEKDGSLWELLLFAIFFVVVFSAVARADESSTQLSTDTVKAFDRILHKPAVEFGLSTNIEQLNSLYVTETPSDVERTEFSVAPSLTYKEKYQASAFVEGIQDEKGERFDIGRTRLIGTYVKGFDLIGNRIKMTPNLTVGLPFAQTARLASLQAQTYLEFVFEFNPDYFVFKKLSASITLEAGKNFHQYETTASGSVNTEYFSEQVADIGWNFTDALKLGLELVHYDTFSYQGTHVDYLGHREELSYDISEHVRVGGGHQWGDPFNNTLKADGQALNLAAANQDSLVFANLRVTL